MARWDLNPQERENLRVRLGQLLVGPEYNPERPLGEQILEKIGGSGSTFQGPLMRFLAGQPKPEKPVEEEWEKMPDDYPSLVEWSRLPVEEKKKVHEALRHNRKIYIVQYSEPSRRGTLDSITLEKQHLQKIMETQW